jgi:tetratricopeptide (TPR) repeat protein
VTEAIGEEHASSVVQRLAGYVTVMLDLVWSSQKSIEGNDLKMRLALGLATLGRDRMRLPFIEAMLNICWRVEPDPIWRTTIKAATRPWFDRLQEVAVRISAEDRDHTLAVLGELPPPEVLERQGYMSLATKGELDRDPLAAAAAAHEAADSGHWGALELKLRANEAVNRGARLEAIDLYRAALRRDPTDAELHFRLGASLWQIADVDEALCELEIAIQLDAGWDRAHVEVAIVYLNQGRDREAAERLESAKRRLRQPSPWLLLHLGFAHERLGMLEEAMRAYTELLDLEQNHAEALDRLAHLCFLAGEKRRGAKLAKRAAHLGLNDVLSAWETGFYDRPVLARPPLITPADLRWLGDNAWLKDRCPS